MIDRQLREYIVSHVYCLSQIAGWVCNGNSCVVSIQFSRGSVNFTNRKIAKPVTEDDRYLDTPTNCRGTSTLHERNSSSCDRALSVFGRKDKTYDGTYRTVFSIHIVTSSEIHGFDGRAGRRNGSNSSYC